MKMWVTTKNEHKASVQRRWDNRGKMQKAFQRWRKRVWHECDERAEGKEDGEGRKEREMTYGMKHWGQNPRNGCLGFPEGYILARGDITIPYHTIGDKGPEERKEQTWNKTLGQMQSNTEISYKS
eukprot:6191354-Pleurochrysis_carterae.AAC.2